MNDPLRLHDVHLTPASPRERDDGLLGYVRCQLGQLRLDGLTLRRTADGRRCLSFPARRDGKGLMRPIVAPIDDKVRREIERQVFEALGLEVAE